MVLVEIKMEQKIANHHVKGELCVTRPAYREGRVPKAVKVYTINNESKYILIQGVPAVGAMKELVRLCSSYGEVEEHYPLDDYPCDDKYTEVYLIKYKKSQSARFAKKKLDDFSFFGGNLHVCYAPEYEKPEETREKLQERRRVIASRIRRLQKESSEEISKKSHQFKNDSAHSSTQRLSPNEMARPQTSISNSTPSTSTLMSLPSPTPPPPSFPHQNIEFHPAGTHSQSTETLQLHSFVLPQPPKQIHNLPPQSKQKYEFSKVPSKHATLQVGYDGRLQDSQPRTSLHSLQYNESSLGRESNPSSSTEEKHLTIKKDYKPSKPVLKFIPRQAVKRSAGESNPDNKIANPCSNLEDESIRQNAFVLGSEHGPVDLPGRRDEMPQVTPEAKRSYNDTIKTIRGKISQVITSTLKPK